MNVYLPHSSCLLNDAWLIGALIIGNALIAYAYMRIPLIYVRALQRYKSISTHVLMRRVYGWTAAFIFCCALTHVFAIATVFVGGGWYWAEATMILLTACISVYTAERIVPLLPQSLAQREIQLSEIARHLKENSNMQDHWETLTGVFEKLEELGGK